MPVSPITESNLTQTESSKLAYPDPFFDLAKNYIPKNIKTLFKFCRTFFYTSGFLRNVVTKLTEYPITDILYASTTDQATKEKYDTALHRKLKIKSFLIEIGLDFFTYGNCFISTYIKPTRFLKCPSCKESSSIKEVSYKLDNRYKFKGTCPKCNLNGVLFTVDDTFTKSIDNFKLLRWAPESIDIEYNPLSGTSTYHYKIPAKIKSSIIKGNKTIINEIPMVFLEALAQKKSITLDTNNLFHFKRPTLAEDDQGWGKPVILPALKDIYYLQTLKRGNEAIANEHVVPKKSIFPANTTTLDPFTQMNLGKWKGQIEDQIKKWKYDPNHIGVFPIPIGYQELGGNARALLLTAEMKFLEETIINSLGVPVEFVKGGTTWTGGSISLRIVENHFLTYRELLEDFLNYFLIYKLTTVLKYPETRLKFKKFKMSDDIQHKNLVVNLNNAGKISDTKLLDEFGFDAEAETAALKASRANQVEDMASQAEADAEARGRATVTMAKYQVRAQAIAASEQLLVETELFQEELAKENVGIPYSPAVVIEKYATEIMALPPGGQNKYLASMSKSMPTTYMLVVKRLQSMQLEQAQQQVLLQQMYGPAESVKKKQVEQVSGEEKPEKKKGQTTGEA